VSPLLFGHFVYSPLTLQVRDEHRQDYDPGRGGWGAQAQRLEIERRREVEERYADAQEGPGAVAGGGGDWKEEDRAVESTTLKRGRSPDDDGDNLRMVSVLFNCFAEGNLEN
jgi:nuclear cap-binding protein subunit 2